MKKIVAINGSPRVGWNTDLMIQEAAKGAEEAGAEVEIFQISKLEPFRGCRSCYVCKTDISRGKCAIKDGLKPVLDKMREADGIIIGTPIYIGEITADLHALVERMIYQFATYQPDNRYEGNLPMKPVLFLVTSNAPLWEYPQMGYDALIDRWVDEFSNAIGPTEVVIADETMMTWNYEKYTWTRFDYDDRRRRREEVFPDQLKAAYEAGKRVFA